MWHSAGQTLQSNFWENSKILKGVNQSINQLTKKPVSLSL
jgi:hypothetical protein